MKSNCEACGLALPPDRTAYVCSYECTFCPVCTSNMHGLCLHCGGELVRRPRRLVPTKVEEIANGGTPSAIRPWIIWALSLGVWAFVALAYGLTVFEMYRSTGQSMPFITVLAMQSSQVLTY